MASSTASSWRARPGCASDTVEHLEGLVNSFPAAYREPPVTGEQFPSLAVAKERLLVFSLVEGFMSVITSGGDARFPAKILKCFHHGITTRNWRELEEHVEKNDAGHITSQRKREGTSARQTNCPWSIRVSYKSIIRGLDEKALVLRVASLDHFGHKLTDNPLVQYPELKEYVPEFQQLIHTAISHRFAVIPYSASRRVLESAEFAFHLSYM
jgi:hypothetical protein